MFMYLLKYLNNVLHDNKYLQLIDLCKIYSINSVLRSNRL